MNHLNLLFGLTRPYLKPQTLETDFSEYDTFEEVLSYLFASNDNSSLLRKMKIIKLLYQTGRVL